MAFFHRPIVEAVEIIAACGFDCVEIWADHVWDEQNGASPAELTAALTQHRLQSTVHCPILDVNIASPNRGIREESVRQVCLSIDLARELGSRLVVLHPGHKYSRLEADEAHWRYQVESLTKILSHAQEQGVLSAVENMDRHKEVYSVQVWADLERLFTHCGTPERWVTLDVTHLGHTQAVLDFIEQAAAHIAHVHLSDCADGRLHLGLGQGSLDLQGILSALRAAGYQGVLSLECFIPNNTPERLRAELVRAKAYLSGKNW